MAPFIPSVPIPSPLHHPTPPPPHSSHHNQNVCLAYVDGAFVIKGLLGWGDVLALIVLESWPHTPQTAPPPPPPPPALHGLFSATPLYKIFCNVSA